MLDFLLSIVITALTELQVDKVLEMVDTFYKTVSSGIGMIWAATAPLLVMYIVYQINQLKDRQKLNRQLMLEKLEESKRAIAESREENRAALAENTQVSKDAFVAANSFHLKDAETKAALAKTEEKVAVLTQKLGTVPLQVELVEHPTDKTP